MITNADIQAGLPAHLQHILTVSTPDLPDTCQHAVDALYDAIRAFERGAHITKPHWVVFGVPPFVIMTTSGGALAYAPDSAGDRLGTAFFGWMICLDLFKLSRYPYDFQVTIILEELVHIQMNVHDEVFVKQIVAWLYPAVPYLKERDVFCQMIPSHYFPDGLKGYYDQVANGLRTVQYLLSPDRFAQWAAKEVWLSDALVQRLLAWGPDSEAMLEQNDVMFQYAQRYLGNPELLQSDADRQVEQKLNEWMAEQGTEGSLFRG